MLTILIIESINFVFWTYIKRIIFDVHDWVESYELIQQLNVILYVQLGTYTFSTSLNVIYTFSIPVVLSAKFNEIKLIKCITQEIPESIQLTF